MAPSKAVSNEAFLAACIRHAKEKVAVDFDAVAKELGITKGGASNKFRAIMKSNEDEGALEAKPTVSNSDGVPGTKGKDTRSSKRKVVPTPAADDSESDDESNGPPPPKKTNAAGKKKGVKKSVPKKAKKPATKGDDYGEKPIVNESPHLKEESESGGAFSDDHMTRAGSFDSIFSRANAVSDYLTDVMD